MKSTEKPAETDIW